MLSRGIRNCNPGNIRLGADRFKGEYRDSEDPLFRQFETIEWGYRAMFLIIHNYNELYGINTLNKIISRWAPTCENNTSAYIDVIARRLNISRGAYINSQNHDVMVKMVSAMSHIETGIPANPNEVEAGWKLFAEC